MEVGGPAWGRGSWSLMILEVLSNPSHSVILLFYKCFQGGSIHSIAGQPVPVSHHSHSNEFLPDILSKSALFQFRTISSHPVATCPSKKPLPSFPVSPLYSVCFTLKYAQMWCCTHESMLFLHPFPISPLHLSTCAIMAKNYSYFTCFPILIISLFWGYWGWNASTYDCAQPWEGI